MFPGYGGVTIRWEILFRMDHCPLLIIVFVIKIFIQAGRSSYGVKPGRAASSCLHLLLLRVKDLLAVFCLECNLLQC